MLRPSAGRFARLRAYQATPTRILIGGAGGLILLGTVLLMLPQAASSGESIGFINALFTATSAVCVTGLIVLDTPADFTRFGHVVLLLLFQVGGLGYMTAATFVALVLGRRVGLKNRLMLMEAMASPTMEGLLRFAMTVVAITLVVEATVAVALTIGFMADMPPLTAAWFGVFHAVSAFNNAGFALMSDSLTRYGTDPFITIPIGVAVIVGGLGFLVLSELVRRARGQVRRLSVHTRVTLVMLLVVGLVGAVLIFCVELGGEGGGSIGEIVSLSLFQAIVSRTSGFGTVDMMRMAGPSVFILILLMMIGGGSGSTAGGIKVTTFGVILASLWATLRGRQEVTLFHRTLPRSIVMKSFFLGFIAFFMVTGLTWLVLALEQSEFLPTLFEVSSAVATVGLSFGDGKGHSFVAGFSDTGKLLITLCMFIGRLGPLTVGIAVLQSEGQQHYRRPTEKVLIG